MHILASLHSKHFHKSSSSLRFQSSHKVGMAFTSLLGHATTTFTHHKNPIKLSTKLGKSLTFLDLVEEALPSCRLNPLLFNGHLQTAYTVMKGYDVPIYYKRKIFEAENSVYQGIFAVDFVVPASSAKDETLPPRTVYYSDQELGEIGSLDTKPMLVALHGLSGGSYELYLRTVLAPLVDAGWEACVVNARGCANSKITTGVLFNARATWDIRQVGIPKPLQHNEADTFVADCQMVENKFPEPPIVRNWLFVGR
jgi:uncharacterized protein